MTIFSFIPERETLTFLQIAQFCNYMVSSNANKIDGQQVDVVTLLSGDNLLMNRSPDCNFSAILDSIPIKYETIDTFYGKLNKKWGIPASSG